MKPTALLAARSALFLMSAMPFPRIHPAFSPDEGAAPVAETPAASAPAAPAASQATPAVTDPAPLWRPDGLPDHLMGKDDRETAEKIFGAYKGMRDKMAQGGEVPKDVAGYVFQPSDKLKPFTEGLDQDPFFGSMRELALKHKMPAPLFQGYFADLMEQMVDKGIVAEAFSPDRERKALAPDITDPKARAEAADRIIQENTALVKAWGAQGEMPQDVANDILTRMNFATTNKLVDWIRESRGEARPALAGNPAGGVTEAEIDKRIADPRNQFGTPEYSKEFAEQTTAMKKAFYGAGSGRRE